MLRYDEYRHTQKVPKAKTYSFFLFVLIFEVMLSRNKKKFMILLQRSNNETA